MTPKLFRAYIRPLPEFLPRTKELETSISVGVGFDGAWYRSQKQHWLGWLAEYSGPGAYGRQSDTIRSAELAYNRIQCAPMLFWLAEALDIDSTTLDAGFQAVVSTPKKGGPQSSAFRRCLRWADIEAALSVWPYSLSDRLLIRLSRPWIKNRNGG